MCGFAGLLNNSFNVDRGQLAGIAGRYLSAAPTAAAFACMTAN